MIYLLRRYLEPQSVILLEKKKLAQNSARLSPIEPPGPGAIWRSLLLVRVSRDFRPVPWALNPRCFGRFNCISVPNKAEALCLKTTGIFKRFGSSPLELALPLPHRGVLGSCLQRNRFFNCKSCRSTVPSSSLKRVWRVKSSHFRSAQTQKLQ